MSAGPLKLFQIEEPDGSPSHDGGPGMAIGIEIEGETARVAVAVGGNAEILRGPDGAERVTSGFGEVAALLPAARGFAERALGRPVTHAVIVHDGAIAPQAFEGSGLVVTRCVDGAAAAARAGGARQDAALIGAALLAEDDAPQP
jgi:hypothetical protein